VGIGTTNPTQKLEVVNSTAVDTAINITNSLSTLKLSSFSSGNAALEVTGAYALRFLTTSTERMRIDASGNVGIGTSSFNQRLRVSGADGQVVGFNGGTRGIRFEFNSTGSVINGVDNTLNASYQQLSVGGSDVRFLISDVERMRIDSSGNVGIGTGSPGTTLDVRGAVTSQADNAYYRIRRAAATDVGYITDSGTWGASGTDFAIGAASSNLRFYTNNSATERMRIDSSGNLLVGTTSNTANAGMNLSIPDLTTKNGFNITNASANTGGSYITFRNSAGNLAGVITQSGSTTVSYTTSSDYRLKENIAPMIGALAKVSQLKPCTYTWKIDGSAGQGFIAHELQAVVPDCVTGEKDAVETYTDEDGNEQTRIKPQGIDTSFLVATLTAAIQELKATVDAQAARIAALESN
jgi:hypothetical protein